MTIRNPYILIEWDDPCYIYFMKILDVGCGNQKTKRDKGEVIGVDNDPKSDADIFHDLNIFPYPFKNDEFDEIICSDVIEHLRDATAFLNEIHRIGKKGARVYIRTPHFSSVNAYIDPTHVRPFSVLSFDCFCENPRIASYLEHRLFRLKKGYISFPKLTRTLFAPFVYLANRFPLRYEQHYAFCMQAENIHIELEIKKE